MIGIRFLEGVLHCQGGVDIESSSCIAGTPDEIVAYLKLCSNTQFVVLSVLPEDVEPELWFALKHGTFLL